MVRLLSYFVGTFSGIIMLVLPFRESLFSVWRKNCLVLLKLHLCSFPTHSSFSFTILTELHVIYIQSHLIKLIIEGNGLQSMFLKTCVTSFFLYCIYSIVKRGFCYEFSHFTWQWVQTYSFQYKVMNQINNTSTSQLVPKST